MLKYLLTSLTVLVWFSGCGSNDCCDANATDVIPKGELEVQKLAPTALISSQTQKCVEGGTITFDARSSTDEDGHIKEYIWLIDSKVVSTGVKPTFSCDTLGTKEVCLQVKDDDNLTSKVCQNYTVEAKPKVAPKAVISGVDKLCTIGDDFIADGSKSSDSDGEVVRYAWIYEGEQNSNLQKPTFNCSKLGEQELCLSVYDNDGLEDKNCTTITVQEVPNKAPIADLNVSSLTCILGESVIFDASNSKDEDGQITQYNWNINNFSGVSNEFNCSKIGTQKVCVTVVDDKGISSNQSCKSVVVSKPANIPPVAKIEVLPQECTVGETVLGDGTTSSDIDGNVTAYLWSVDANDSVSSLAKPIFKCDKVGIKHICLKVTDNEGAASTNQACKDVTVKEKVIQTIPPVAVIDVVKNVDDDTPSVTAKCDGSYDPDQIDGDNNPQNDGKILTAEFTVSKTFQDGSVEDPHTGTCPKWISTPDNLKSMTISLTVTDDDGESTTKTEIYDWDGDKLILRQ